MCTRVLAIALLVATTLGACTSSGSGLSGLPGMPSKELLGTGTGVVGGAVLGAVIAKQAGASPVLGALIGGVAGGLIGNRIGNALDEQERAELAVASQRAVVSGKTGQRVAWSVARPKREGAKATAKPQEPMTNAAQASGWVIPTTDAYKKADGQTCRDLHQVAVKDDKTIENDVTACRGASGWEIPSG